jgi:hypothetical protein
MVLTAIRLNSDWTDQWYSLLQKRLKVYVHSLKGVYAILPWLSSYCTRSWHNTSNYRLCISPAFQWKSHFGRAKSITKRTVTYSLSYDISCVCFFHCWALVAMLDGCSVGTTWELLSLLWDARGLSGKSGIRCPSNAQCRKLFSPCILNLVPRLLIHKVPRSCARWRLGHIVFINEQNAGYEPNRRNSSIYIPSSRLHLHSLFLQ